MKILHCSDVHLGRRPVGGLGEYSRKRFEDYFLSFEWAVNTAIEKEINVFLIAGDFFDKKELIPEVLTKTELILDKLKQAGIEVILIEGNHDNITYGNESDSWLTYLEGKGLFRRPFCYHSDNYKFSSIIINNLNFYGVGYPGSYVNETLTELANQLDDRSAESNIILVHTAIADSQTFLGTVKKETIDLLCNKAIYIAGGHFHSYYTYPAENPYFFLPGSLEYWDNEEFGKKKGIIIFDTETKKHEFIESKKRHAVKISVSIDNTDIEDIYAAIDARLSEFPIEKDESLINITLNLSKSIMIDLSKIENHLKDKGFLKSTIRIILPENIGLKDLSNPLLGVDQVEHEIIKTWDIFSTNTELTFSTLSSMKQFQENSSESEFFSVFDDFMEKLLSKKEENNEN